MNKPEFNRRLEQGRSASSEFRPVPAKFVEVAYCGTKACPCLVLTLALTRAT